MKKNKLTGIVGLLASLAWAGWMLVVLGVAVVVGAVLAWKLIELIHRVLPADANHADGTTQAQVFIVTNTPPPQVQNVAPNPPSKKTFSIQYGLRANFEPWTSMDGEEVIIPSFEWIGSGENKDGTFSLTFIDLGTVYYWQSDWGLAEPLNDPAQVYNVTICRSTNLIDWSAIATNVVNLPSTQVFTDTDAPPDRAYYRSALLP